MESGDLGSVGFTIRCQHAHLGGAGCQLLPGVRQLTTELDVCLRGVSLPRPGRDREREARNLASSRVELRLE